MARTLDDKVMPQELKEEMFNSIHERLDGLMSTRERPEEIAYTLNYILTEELERVREAKDGSKYNFKPIFVGQYIVDPENPTQTRVYSAGKGRACSPISISKGVIGTAVTTGEDQYVPDVASPDLDHVSCDDEMQGSELVLISWSEAYASGRFAGKQVPLGVLDLDVNVKNAWTPEDIQRFRNIWDQYGPKIFPGEASFLPKGNPGVYIRPTPKSS